MSQFQHIASSLLFSSLLLFLSACQEAPPKQQVQTNSSSYSSSVASYSLTPSPTDASNSATNALSLVVPKHSGTSPTQKASSVTPTPTVNAPSSPTATKSAQPAVVVTGPGGIPRGFPRYFSFGAMNDQGAATALDNMRATNGAAFAFRYQYLTGGVNTGRGWETWDAGGQYALNYMLESDQHGYIPAFVYYELCLSNGPQPGSYCGGHNVAQNTGNLASASTMKAYFANWVLLMQKIRAFGKPALVIVEPDLWAFLENATNGTDNAADVPASIASSGHADAAGFPNTVQGFAWALLHIRDKFAPNALLALHASTWAGGTDIATDTRASLDVAAVVRRESAFLNSAGLVGNPAGVSSWDVLSNDAADFDSAQPGGRSWWDRSNQTFPNFARYLDFIYLLSQATHRRVVMWQVPEGNQYFATMNNSPGHYQDNRAEYILGNVASFARAGVISVLFGPGNNGTINVDAQHDGITNPAPINSYQCNMCNTHKSSYADDDGGYLRLFIGQYMQHPVPLA